MRLLFSKSPWEIYDDPLESCLGRIVEAGYDALEIDLLNRSEPLSAIQTLLRDAALPVIVQINTRGSSPTVEAQLEALRTHYEQGLFAEPLFFNSHTGKDWFSFEENLRIFELGCELTEKYGIPIVHENHRGCALYNVPISVRFLQALPALRLTADFAHWFCVHESDLADQTEAMNLVIQHTDHIHARVGFSEGSQVSDPRNPLYKYWTDRCIDLWQQIVDKLASEGKTEVTITPEFGPFGYLPLRGIEPIPVADPWEINLWMRDELRRKLKCRL